MQSPDEKKRLFVRVGLLLSVLVCIYTEASSVFGSLSVRIAQGSLGGLCPKKARMRCTGREDKEVLFTLNGADRKATQKL